MGTISLKKKTLIIDLVMFIPNQNFENENNHIRSHVAYNVVTTREKWKIGVVAFSEDNGLYFEANNNHYFNHAELSEISKGFGKIKDLFTDTNNFFFYIE